MTKQDAPTTTDAERAARDRFEAWVMAQPGAKPSDIYRRDMPGSERIGQYVNFAVEFAWQAARASSAAAQWISVDERLPEPGKAVLLDIGEKTPIRALWAAKHSVEAGDECPEDWAEYDEATDTYYVPPDWYEWNRHEETHWRVHATARAWCDIPAPPAKPADTGEAPTFPTKEK